MTTRLKCLLLDDEHLGLTYLKMLCEQLPQLEVVKAFDNPILFLKEIDGLDFDLCIIDVEMPQMNGLQVAELLKGKPVVFVTAYKEYASDAFDLNAVDYVRKPVKLDRLKQAVQKAIQHIHNKPSNEKSFIQLNTDKGKTILFFETISYIRTADFDSRDKIARLVNGEEYVLKNISFDKLLSTLPTSDFCRINKKELIALKAVQTFTYDEITTNLLLPTGKKIKLVLSELYRNEFLLKVQV